MTIQRSARVGLTLRQAQTRFDEAMSRPGVVAQMIEQDDHRWTVVVFVDDAGAPVAAAELSGFSKPLVTAPAPLPAAATHGAAQAGDAPESLGALSARFESNGKAGSIGHDSTGGFSYGAYQIATKTGTMARFLDFLRQQFTDMAQPLTAAGGAVAAEAGSNTFTTAWRKLAEDPRFLDAQHRFIEVTHYLPFAAKLLRDQGIDVAVRSAALRDVVWSVAVQHGASNEVFANALIGMATAEMSDLQIIDAVYAERSNVDKYFASSSPQVKASVADRFVAELAQVHTQFA